MFAGEDLYPPPPRSLIFIDNENEDAIKMINMGNQDLLLLLSIALLVVVVVVVFVVVVLLYSLL